MRSTQPSGGPAVQRRSVPWIQWPLDGGGGGGGGGAPFGNPEGEPDRLSEDEKVQQIVDIILETIEPDAWQQNGGDAASIRYYEGVLIIRAPDYIQRQIGGYPFAPRRQAAPAKPRNGRYVTFTAPISIIENVKFRGTTVTGSAGSTGNP